MIMSGKVELHEEFCYLLTGHTTTGSCPALPNSVESAMDRRKSNDKHWVLSNSFQIEHLKVDAGAGNGGVESGCAITTRII
jgi:hypothetical protein